MGFARQRRNNRGLKGPTLVSSSGRFFFSVCQRGQMHDVVIARRVVSGAISVSRYYERGWQTRGNVATNAARKSLYRERLVRPANGDECESLRRKKCRPRRAKFYPLCHTRPSRSGSAPSRSPSPGPCRCQALQCCTRLANESCIRACSAPSSARGVGGEFPIGSDSASTVARTRKGSG